MSAATRNAKVWPGMVFLLSRGPRTQKELADLLGTKLETISRYLHLLEDEGLVATDGRELGKRGLGAMRWQWLPVGTCSRCQAPLPELPA